MTRFELSPTATFIDLMGEIEEYAYPFRQMWPSFWLKAAAIRDNDVWRLCVFALSGRWSDEEPIKPFSEQLGALAAISRRINATAAWEMFESLQATKTITLEPGVVAVAPEPYVPNIAQWQERVSRPISDLLMSR
jgi:hypothetical protein